MSNINTNGKTIRAAFLLRMSTDQQKDSPARQRANVLPACKANNLEIVAEYADLGISGLKTSKRAGLREMLKDAKAGKFEVLVVDSIDRLSRLDSVDIGEIVKPLRQAGVTLFSASEGWRDLAKFSDRLSFMVSTELSNQFASSLAYKTLSGRMNKIRAGKISARRCYGYDRLICDENGNAMARVRWDETFAKPKDWTSQLVPTSDSKVLDTIRWMFHFYAETDESLNSVTKSLNDRGIPTSEGKSWRTGTVKRMLSNPVYIGVARFGVEKSGSFFQMAPNGEIETGNGDHENGSRSYSYDSPALQFENAHEPIIEKDTFEAVQAKLQRRKTFPSRRGQRSRSYPLTGILRCGACGGSLSGHTATIRDKGAVKNHIRYYTCSGSKAHLCVEWCLRSEEIEKLMTEFAVEHLESQIELLTQAIEQEVTNRKQKKPTKKNHLRKELDALTLKIDRGVEAILEADKNHIPELSRKLQQWKDRRDELQRELNNQPPKEKDESINPKAVIAKFRNLAATIKKASPVDAREFYCQVFDHIDIFWNDSAPRGRKFDRGIVFFG